jgi:hypothetical protein
MYFANLCRLGMHKPGQPCTDLLEMTANALSGEIMDAQQDHSQIPDIQFRILIIGRANSGKTSILQRMCDTTEGPMISNLLSWRTRDDRVRSRS